MTSKIVVHCNCDPTTTHIKGMVFNLVTDEIKEEFTLKDGQKKEIIFYGDLVIAVGEVPLKDPFVPTVVDFTGEQTNEVPKAEPTSDTTN